MDLIRLIVLSVAVLAPAAAQAEPRIALVIGNSEYDSGRLANPANDAKLVDEALTHLKFDVVLRRNANQTEMKRAIQDFGERLEKAGPEAVGLFYYAGHGLQLNGSNYLIPTKAHIEREGDVEIEAVGAEWVIEQMRYARNRLNIVILDACRDNPFTRSMRSVDHGLASMHAPAGMFIAYSTAPGDVAADGSGRNSPYTQALTQEMREAGEPIEMVFKRVRVEVMVATSGKQVPWEHSSLTGDFYFADPKKSPPERAGTADLVVPNAAIKPAPAPVPEPTGTFFSRLFSSWNTPEPVKTVPEPVGPAVTGVRAVPLLQSLGVEAAAIDAAHNYPERLVRETIERTARRVTLGSTPEEIRAAFGLCRQYSASCQLSWYSDEKSRSATLMPFQLDPVPVSVGAFRQFADATHYKTQAERLGYAYAVVAGHHDRVAGGNWRNAVKRHAVEDELPVVGVSFQDAAEYCQYRDARLPTEDEWEYIARGPERHVFPWGDGVDPAVAAVSAPPRVGDGPAGGIGGSYRGLSGNVWQWVDTTIDGRKVLKGASWLEPNPANRRAATRRYELAARADEDSGFRCAKSVAAWPDAELWLSRLK